jgi:hypothetical protein
MIIAEMSPEQAERSQEIWNKFVEQCRSGPLPFVKSDPANPQVIASLWDATASDNEVEDAMRASCVRSYFFTEQKTGAVVGTRFKPLPKSA